MINQVIAGHTPLHEYIFVKGNNSSSEDDAQEQRVGDDFLHQLLSLSRDLVTNDREGTVDSLLEGTKQNNLVSS
jgi:hypothetical protein